MTFKEFEKTFPKSKLLKKMLKKTNWKNKKKINHDTGESYIIQYLNMGIAFDIESSSFYDNGEKRAVMYLWQFAVQDTVIYGRTWGEFKELMEMLSILLHLDINRRILVYIHNLNYEYQWFRFKFNWVDLFAREDRRPMYAVTDFGVEFRCSWLLTGKKLDDVGEEVGKKKLKEQMNYDIIRTPETPLDEETLEYGMRDVEILTSLIENKIKEDGDITKIPLTKTGYVRNYVRKHCLYTNGRPNKSYQNMIKNLTMELPEYKLATEAYLGAFTHASNLNSGIAFGLMDNLNSFDFTSSYPAVICQKFGYPIGKGRRIFPKNEDELINYGKHYCTISRVTLHKLKSTFEYEHIISYSRCIECEGEILDNGRIVSADRITISVSEIDLFWIKRFYEYEYMDIGTTYLYKRGYLPKEIIECTLELYRKKTELKGVSGCEEEYRCGKEMLNSLYGMMCLAIITDQIEYVDDWVTNKVSDSPLMMLEQLESDNNSKSRFTFYLWGLYITAWARSNLYEAIYELKGDYLYSDTDSVKIKNYIKHKDFFENYNKKSDKEIENCLKYYGLDTKLYRPKNKYGEEKPLGWWDEEGEMLYFKALRSKAYIYKKMTKTKENGEEVIKPMWHLTVAGTGKDSTMKYIEEKHKTDEAILEAFADGLEIPAENTGKLTHTYIDCKTEGEVTDYLGNTYHYQEDSSIHMEKCGYEISLGDYADWLLGIQKYVKQ